MGCFQPEALKMIHNLDYNVFRIPSIWTWFEIKADKQGAKTDQHWTSLGFDKLKKSFIVIFENQSFKSTLKVEPMPLLYYSLT